MAHTLDRLDRTVPDTLNLIHDLTERGDEMRSLADPIRLDSSARDDLMAQLAVVRDQRSFAPTPISFSRKFS